MQSTAQEFYGSAYGRAKDAAKLDAAFKTFGLAMKATNPEIEKRALALAATKEAEAFA